MRFPCLKNSCFHCDDMIYPAKMQKVRIYALTSVISEMTKRLQESGLMEINVSEIKGMHAGAPLESFNEISTQHVRMRSIKAGLEKRGAAVREVPNALEEARSIAIDSQLKDIYTEIARLEADLQKIAEEVKLTKKLEMFGNVDFAKLETRSTSYLLGSIPRENLAKAQDAMGKSQIRHKLMFVLREKEAFLLVIFERGSKEAVEQAISKFGFVQMSLPESITTCEKYKFWLERESRNKAARIVQLKAEISSLSDKYSEKIANLAYSLSIAADRAEIASKFSFSKFSFIITGWVEAKKMAELENVVGEYPDKAVIEKARKGHHEMAPTVLENPSIVKPFEFMTKSYSFPNAEEFDPSLTYFFTIPLLYGMIVADVVYGVISIFVALFFMNKFRKSETMQAVSKLWLFSSIPAIFFGLIFDEYAGMTHYHLLEKLNSWGIVNLQNMGIHEPLYSGLSRLHNLTTVFQITLYVGMIHLALGLLFGALNEWKHSKKHAIGKLAWIGVEIGGYIAISTFLFNAMPADMGNIGAGILLLSAILIAWAEGVVGILELPGIAGNVFSYLRIAVVGVVGTILAELINEIFMPMPQHGLALIILIPLFLALHVLNAFIAMFEALIQGGRLNIIEFKLKFMKGGGRPFRPFALKH